VPQDGAQGVIFAEGGRNGGFSLYVSGGRVVYENNSLGRTHEKIVAAESLPAGHVTIRFDFVPANSASQTTTKRPQQSPTPGSGTLSVNGKVVGDLNFSWFGNFGETFDVGSDLGSPVSDAYSTPFSFNGTINKVALDLH
jgi:arylsulfatase